MTLCGYGNLDLSGQGDDFWNFGAFEISPMNQVLFIRKLYEGDLPFSKQNMETVKRVMITEQNEHYTIHSKTGWTRTNSMNIGCWVGYIETKAGTYIFATRLLEELSIANPDFGTARKEITKSILRDLQVLSP